MVVTREPSTWITGQAAGELAICGEKPYVKRADSGDERSDMVPPRVQIVARRSGGMWRARNLVGMVVVGWGDVDGESLGRTVALYFLPCAGTRSLGMGFKSRS